MKPLLWINQMPEGIIRARTRKEAEKHCFLGTQTFLVEFPWETVWVCVHNNRLLMEDHSDGPEIADLRLHAPHRRVMALNNLYAPFNRNGIDLDSHDGWTDLGRAVVGAIYERNKFKEEERCL